MDECHANIEQSRPTSNGDEIERYWSIIALVQVNVHVLAGVVAAYGRNY